MSEISRPDIAIAGGGFAGLTLALALVRCLGPGLQVAVVDRGAYGQDAHGDYDPRAVAVSASSVRLLTALGLWDSLREGAEPVRRIEITDSGLEAGLRPVLLTWDNAIADGGEPSMAAHIVSLSALIATLEAAVASEPAITLVRPAQVTGLAAGPFDTSIELADGGTIHARLAVAADGTRSVLREAAGIKSVGWRYAQLGIVTTVAHTREHGGVAVQHFLPSGPFAILPLPGRRSCVTWSEAEADGRRIMALDDQAFLSELEQRLGGRLGTLSLAGSRRAWPLALHIARGYVGPRLALVGDAAHAVHPIAGQGLNLAFRDVAALTEVVADTMRAGLDPGDTLALERYERWRRFDSMVAAAAFDGLNRLFSRDSRLLRSAREVGLQVVDRLPAVKRALVGEAAGMTGELPKLLNGELA